MDKASLIRTIILGVAFVNQFLVAAGHSPLPIEDESVELLISSGFTLAAALWTWWKNNYISTKGQRQKKVLEREGLK